ncbi:MAG: hypothetical protein J4F35_12050 [Candidatus Latescibacteria bacterium]|nr:hypothetical protein [Candidatus Latescibacterota bacterium]
MIEIHAAIYDLATVVAAIPIDFASPGRNLAGDEGADFLSLEVGIVGQHRGMDHLGG